MMIRNLGSALMTWKTFLVNTHPNRACGWAVYRRAATTSHEDYMRREEDVLLFRVLILDTYSIAIRRLLSIVIDPKRCHLDARQ